MKRTTLIGAILILLAATACQKQAENADGTPGNSASTQPTTETSLYPRRYLVESGIVEGKVSGMQKGTETIYFDRWGWREAKYTNTELAIGGISRKESKLSLMDGDWLYTIDLASRTGTKIKNPMLHQFIEAAKGRSLTEVGEEMMRRMGGEKSGSDTVAGQPI